MKKQISYRIKSAQSMPQNKIKALTLIVLSIIDVQAIGLEFQSKDFRRSCVTLKKRKTGQLRT